MKTPPRAGFFSRLFSENKVDTQSDTGRDREIRHDRFAATVDDPASIDDEIRDRLAALAT
jgi:hypothetical protein